MKKRILLALFVSMTPLYKVNSEQIYNIDKESFNNYKKGLESYSLHTIKDYENSINYFDNVIKNFPDFNEAVCSKAISQAFLASRLKNVDEKKYYSNIIDAEFNTLNSLKINSNSFECNKAMSIVYTIQGKYDKGKEYANKSIILNTNDSDAYLFLWLSEPNKKYDQNIQKAIDLNKNSILAHYELGNFYTFSSFSYNSNNINNLYITNDNTNQAIIEFEKSLKLNPKFLYSYIGLARINFIKVQSLEALNNLYKALEVIEIDDRFLNLLEGKNDLGYKNLNSSLLSFLEIENLYKKLLDMKKNNVKILERLASFYSDNSKYNDSINMYKKLIEINPENFLYKHKIAIEYYKNGDYKNSNISSFYPELKNIDFNKSETHRELGDILLKNSQRNLAIIAYKNSIKIEPNNILSYINLIDNISSTNQYYNHNFLSWNTIISNEIIDYFKKIISLDPSNAEYHFKFANYLYQNKLIDQAFTEIKKAISLNPDFEPYHTRIAEFYMSQNNIEQALNSYNKAINLSPDASAPLGNLADYYFKKGDYDKSLELYNSLIKKYPFHYNYYEKLEQIYKKIPSNSNKINPFILFKINSYKTDIERNTNNVEIRNRLASYYFENNLIDDAINEYKNVLVLEPLNNKAINSLADLYIIKSNQIKKISESFDIKLNPKDLKSYINLSNVYIKYNDFDNAIKTINQGININKDYKDFYEQLSNIYLKKSEFEKNKLLNKK